MSFLDLYEGDQAQAARMQPNEGTRLPSGFTENFDAAWGEGKLFSQSIAQLNARGAALDDYAGEVKRKTGIDVAADLAPKEGGAPLDYDAINKKIGSPDIAPLSDDEIDQRALAKSQAAHRTYETLQSGERTGGGSFGSFLGSAASAAADPINIVGLAIAPETGGISILSSALRWGALAGVSQAAIEAASDTFKEQVQPGYMESGQPLREIGGAFLGGAVLGGTTKALGNAWTKVKTGQWPTSVRDAGNVIESEANVANTNPFAAQPPKPLMSDAEIAAAVSGQPTPEAQASMARMLRADREAAAREQQAEITAGMSMQPIGAAGEVAHREAMVKAIDDILAGRPVDVSAQITPDLLQAAAKIEAEKAKIISAQTPTAELKQAELPLAPETEPVAPKIVGEPGPQAPLQTAKEMTDTLTAPDHQDAIRADIDRERAMGDFKVPGVDENGNHTMASVDAEMEKVDAYKKLADDIQACANPPAAEAAE